MFVTKQTQLEELALCEAAILIWPMESFRSEICMTSAIADQGPHPGCTWESPEDLPGMNRRLWCKISLALRMWWQTKTDLLSNADVKSPLRELLLKSVHASATAHGRMDADDALVLLGLGNQCIRKKIGVAGNLHMHTILGTAHVIDRLDLQCERACAIHVCPVLCLWLCGKESTGNWLCFIGNWLLLQKRECERVSPKLQTFCAQSMHHLLIPGKANSQSYSARCAWKVWKHVTHPSFGLLLLAGDRIILPDAMHLVSGALCWQVAATLLSDDVDEHRTNSLCSLHLCTWNSSVSHQMLFTTLSPALLGCSGQGPSITQKAG